LPSASVIFAGRVTLLGNEYRVAGPAFSISLLLSFADTAAPALDELYRRSGDQPETEQQADEEDEEDEVEVVENATGMAPREGERAGDGGRDGDGGELTTTALGRNPVSTRLILL
jgi:hypothetical protein